MHTKDSLYQQVYLFKVGQKKRKRGISVDFSVNICFLVLLCEYLSSFFTLLLRCLQTHL